MGASPEADYTPATVGRRHHPGGMARLASAVATARTRGGGRARRRCCLLDAGDFMMGTLFETISAKVAAELAMMHALGYDATTIGNHELDWGPDGLAAILQAAVANGKTVPIVASNMVFDPDRSRRRQPAGAGHPRRHHRPSWSRRWARSRSASSGSSAASAAQVAALKAPADLHRHRRRLRADGRRPAPERPGRPRHRALALGDLQRRHG